MSGELQNNFQERLDSIANSAEEPNHAKEADDREKTPGTPAARQDRPTCSRDRRRRKVTIAETEGKPGEGSRPVTGHKPYVAVDLRNWQLNGGAALAAICLGLAVSMAGCATHAEPLPAAAPPITTLPPPPSPPASATPQTNAEPSKAVKASYQGRGTAGQPTASGEPYNPNDLTAASRNLPMGSTVKVTNPDTGRSVKVRINDRGPFVHGRSLDLSKGAAEKIGITHKGVARVKVTRVNSHTVSGEPESPSPIATPAAQN